MYDFVEFVIGVMNVSSIDIGIGLGFREDHALSWCLMVLLIGSSCEGGTRGLLVAVFSQRSYRIADTGLDNCPEMLATLCFSFSM